MIIPGLSDTLFSSWQVGQRKGKIKVRTGKGLNKKKKKQKKNKKNRVSTKNSMVDWRGLVSERKTYRDLRSSVSVTSTDAAECNENRN